MTFTDAIDQLFASYEAPKDAPRIEMKRGIWAWKALPLEWNQAKRLADVFGAPVRLVSANGVVILRHEPEGSQPQKDGA